MKIGLLGAGTIGFGVCEITDKMPQLEIVKVLDRRDIPGLEGKLTKDADDILNDPSIDTVVELLGGVEPARTWALKALKAGKNVVTANKLMVSESLTELMAAAKEGGATLRFSAAVGGGIPYLFNLLRARRVDDILEVGGILNGTTNYMLDLMSTQGIDYAEVLKLAQDAGYAEADPTADVSGGDTKCKIMLSSCIAWDGLVNKADILCEGITSVSKADIDIINERGYACKLLASAKKAENGISCYVEPTLVRRDSVPGAIALVENMATFVGANAGPQRFTGAGAGRYATAYAVVEDLIDVDQNPGAFSFSISGKEIAIDNSAEKHCYMVRGLEIEGADEIAEGVYITGEIAVSEMHAMAAAARAEGKKVFFAGIRD